MIYPSSISSIPFEIIKKIQTLIFNSFLWNRKDKVIHLLTYGSNEFGGLNMIDFESMVKALILSWLKRISDKNCNGLFHIFRGTGGVPLPESVQTSTLTTG